MKILNTLFFCLLAFACKAQTTGKETKPADLNDGINTAFMSSVGVNPDTINELTNKINSGYYPNIHSLLIYKNGYLVYENYFMGKDEKWGVPAGITQHSINDLHDLRSITKSVVSACVGIAINQGKIKSIDQNIFDFFKEYSDLDTGLKKGITIRQLLTMSSGLKWNEDVPYNNPENSEILMTNSKDPVKFALSQPVVTTPGVKWNYNGGTVQLLAAIIEKVTGKTLDKFANENLFVPLGINSFYWYRFPGSNECAAASGLRLRSRDILKFAILYRQDGVWQGIQILPKEWVQQSFIKQISISDNLGYGYLFWKVYPPVTYKKIPELTAGVGNGDERIFFDDKNKLIVVVTAGNYNTAGIFGKTNSLAMLKDYVYPSFIK